MHLSDGLPKARFSAHHLTLMLLLAAFVGPGAWADEREEFDAGVDRARRDFEKGQLLYRQPIPEVMLMGRLRGEQKDENLLEYFGALLRDRHGIRYEWVMFNSASPDVRAGADGYNSVMVPEIEKRFGKDVLDKTWKDAYYTSPEKRTAYVQARPAALEQRKAATRAATQPATQAVWQPVAGGQLVLRPFAHAPYPHVSREDGLKGRWVNYPLIPHYTDATVGIFIPPGYAAGETVDFVVHFHGHNNHVANVIPHYRLAEQLAEAKVNAILLVPQGPRDVPDSGGGKLELDAGAFAQLIDEVAHFLAAEGKIRTTRVGRIILTSHSGGYKVTAAVLDHGGLADHVTDVLLLDASYGSLGAFAKWAAAAPSHRLVSLYTTHLAAESNELMQLLTTAKTPFVTLEEDSVTDEQLAHRGATFMATKVAHDAVPLKYFGRLLRTSDPMP